MKKKNRWQIILIVVFIILIIFCCVRFYSKGYNINYKLGEKGEFQIKEIYTKNVKGERDNYYIEIQHGKYTFNYQFFNSFSVKRKIVKDVIFYDGEYKCMLPIIENGAQTDIKCYKDNRYYNYVSIYGKEKKLDEFVNNIDINFYDKDDWSNESTEVLESKGIKLYKYNIVEDHYVGLTNLKGTFILNKKINNIEIFSNDIYSRDLSAIVGKYYVTADYTQKNQFRTFYFVDLETGKKKEAKAPNYISFDSYVQGIVDDNLYIYDKDNEKQYKINTKKLSINEIGNKNKKIQYYNNGEWEKITTTKANKKVLFNRKQELKEFQKFEYIYLNGGKTSGVYYLFEKDNEQYKVYKAYVQNKKNLMYLFNVDNIKDVFYVDDYIYFKDKNTIKYYNDTTGIRTLLEYSELEFNNNLLFGVYKRK